MPTTIKAKSKKTNAPATAAAHQTRSIRLSLHHPEAHTVCLAGSFNDWQPDHLQPDAEGKWSIELSLPPGDYEYLFVVDERWLPDPACAERQPNPFGGENSVLHVPTNSRPRTTGTRTGNLLNQHARQPRHRRPRRE